MAEVKEQSRTPGPAQSAVNSGWVYWVTIGCGALITIIALAFAYDLELLRILEIPKEQALPLVLGSGFVIIFLRIPASSIGTRTDPPWYDIALAANRPALAALFAYVSSSQVLLGTDYPFGDTAETIRGLEAFGLNVVDIDAIFRGNAERLIPRLKKTAPVS